MGNVPKWWSDEHSSTWDRVKAAMKRDWEQTKSDVSKHSKDLDQGAGDTVKQAMGKERIPPPNQPNAKDSGKGDKDWDRVEDDYRYGVGARQQYGSDHTDWDDRLESKLKAEWNDLRSGRTWDEVKGSVRHGWERFRK